MQSDDQLPLSPYLPHYQGPYPRKQLERARSTLIRNLLDKDTPTIRSIKAKCGITQPVSNGSMPILTQTPPSTYHRKGFNSQPPSYATYQNASNHTLPESRNSEWIHKESQNSTQVRSSSCSTSTTSTSSNSNDLCTISTDANDSQSHLPNSSTSGTSLIKDNQRNYTIFDRSHNETQEREDSEVKETIVCFYKCDYCDVTQLNFDDMFKHLIDDFHYTASTCEGQYEDGKLKVQYLIKAAAAKNAVAKNQKFVVVCPNCCELHQLVQDCCTHYQHVHKAREGMYSICPVTYKQTVSISEYPQCKTCGINCASTKLLHKHWKTFSHEPYEMPHKGNFLVFICPFCETRSRSFLQTKEHALCHKRSGTGIETSAVNVLHIKFPASRLSLPPIRPETKVETQIDNELSNLKQLTRNNRKTGIQKPNKKYIKHKITALKNMKKAGYI